jgi:NTE family protein
VNSGQAQGNGGPVDLVLEGGGVKGIGLVGALTGLDERGFVPQNVAGTSAGAITAALVAAGYTVADMKKILSELDYARFKDKTALSKVPLIGEPLSALTRKGISKGDYFHKWIEERLAANGVHTFRDLVVEEYKDEPKYRYRLQVIATDITGHEMLRLPRDAERFGVNPDDLSVADAVRMSMSIPIFFEPWRWRTKDGQEHLIVDGGVLSNFPVWIFDSEGEPPWPTFGLMLVEPDPKAQPGADQPTSPDDDVITYLKDLASTMMGAHDRMYLQNDTFVRTIPIPTLGVGTTEFDLPEKRAGELFESGRKAALEFVDQKWNFEEYKRTFRSGERPTRSATVLPD